MVNIITNLNCIFFNMDGSGIRLCVHYDDKYNEES